MFKEVYDRGIAESARRTRAVASQIFAFGRATHKCSRNPAKDMADNPYFMKPQVQHYAKNLNPGKSIRGALVYLQCEHEVDELIGTEVGSIRVKTVNFRQDWGVVSQELLELVT